MLKVFLINKYDIALNYQSIKINITLTKKSYFKHTIFKKVIDFKSRLGPKQIDKCLSKDCSWKVAKYESIIYHF